MSIIKTRLIKNKPALEHWMFEGSTPKKSISKCI